MFQYIYYYYAYPLVEWIKISGKDKKILDYVYSKFEENPKNLISLIGHREFRTRNNFLDLLKIKEIFDVDKLYEIGQRNLQNSNLDNIEKDQLKDFLDACQGKDSVSNS